jgi:hypothetical protein
MEKRPKSSKKRDVSRFAECGKEEEIEAASDLGRGENTQANNVRETEMGSKFWNNTIWANLLPT